MAIWVVVVVFGMRSLMLYGSNAGADGLAPERWPESAECRRDANRMNLLMFLHPKCFCSRASLSELEKLQSHFNDQISVKIIFWIPDSVSEDWKQCALWKKVQGMVGVEGIQDSSGKLASRFGAKTSGQVVLYDQQGWLKFQGGVTAMRGEEGSNAGVEMIKTVIRKSDSRISSTPVFGCALGSGKPADI